MKKVSPVYRKLFTRDFSLPVIEIWGRAETVDHRIWTDKRQPHLPYLVFMRKNGMAEAYYDDRGISWMTKVLLDKVKKDKKFLFNLERTVEKKLKWLQNMYRTRERLSEPELRFFLSELENIWIWFDAAWWLWDLEPHESNGVKLSHSFLKLREDTQDEGSGTDRLVRNSVTTLYPQFGELAPLLLASEIKAGRLPSKDELSKRSRSYFFVEGELHTGLSVKDAEKKFGMRFETIDGRKTKELLGQTAQRGWAQGPVKVVLSSREAGKVKKGDILVSSMTLPDLLPAIKKAAAIVTDEGGIMCHAAIVSRELGIPCVIGTKIATKVLKDGDIVEVDAERGTVKIIEKSAK